jgi:methionyl-tRNA formyltransferase
VKSVPGPAVPGRLRVVFFGTPAFAVPSLQALIQSRHRVVAVVSQPDRPKGRGHEVQATPTKAIGDASTIPVLQPARIRDEGFLQQIRDLRPDLGIVVAFGRILPDALLAIPRLGMINVHASILPRYRGAAPIQRAVLAGDPETGVTIMRVIAEMDAGPTFATASVAIPPDATSGEMAGTLAHLGAQLLLPVVDDLAAGRAVETAQDASRATHAPKITKAEGTIDWSERASAVHNKVRGLQPWPLASSRLTGERLVLRRTVPGVRSGFASSPGVRSGNEGSEVTGSPDVGTSDLTPSLANADLTPGTVVRARGDELIVACGDATVLRILELQPEGRRTMTVREFLSGHGAIEGTRFER